MQDDEQEEEEETSPDNEATGFLNSSVNRSNISINRSGHSCIQYTGVDVAVQTVYISYWLKLHINKRGCTNEIKSAFARSPPVCCVLIENYIKAVPDNVKRFIQSQLLPFIKWTNYGWRSSTPAMWQPFVYTSFSQGNNSFQNNRLQLHWWRTVTFNLDKFSWWTWILIEEALFCIRR